MEEAKYKIGDKVWVMCNNRVQEITIRVVGVRGVSEGEHNSGMSGNLVMYSDQFYADLGVCNWLYEHEIFSTKSDLIKTL